MEEMQLGDGYYLMEHSTLTKPVPVEIYTVTINRGEKHRYVRGLHIACTLRKAQEDGATFTRLVPIETDSILPAVQLCAAAVKYAYHRRTVEYLSMDEVIAAEKLEKWLDGIRKASNETE
jgi:hypothetical protein